MNTQECLVSQPCFRLFVYSLTSSVKSTNYREVSISLLYTKVSVDKYDFFSQMLFFKWVRRSEYDLPGVLQHVDKSDSVSAIFPISISYKTIYFHNILMKSLSTITSSHSSLYRLLQIQATTIRHLILDVFSRTLWLVYKITYSFPCANTIIHNSGPYFIGRRRRSPSFWFSCNFQH